MNKTIYIAAIAALASTSTQVSAQTSNEASDVISGAEAAGEAVADAMEAVEAADETAMVEIETLDVPPELPRDPQSEGEYWNLITQADYPADAWLAEIEGKTEFQLSIDASGDVRSCMITSSSGATSLDEATCELMQRRAKFSPALNSDGEAVAGVFQDSHRWSIRKQEFGVPLLIEVAFTVDERGQTTDCEVLQTRGDLPRGFERENCPGMNGSNAPPYRDEQGNPVKKRVVLKLEVSEIPLTEND